MPVVDEPLPGSTMTLVLNGDEVDEPVSELNLPLYLAQFFDGDVDSFIILLSERGFVQASKRKDGSFMLERKEGSAAEHWECSAENLSREQLVFAFESYFLGNPAWASKFSWTLLEWPDGEEAPKLSELKRWHMWVLLAFILAWLIWSIVKTYG
jgi:hypothetical protein